MATMLATRKTTSESDFVVNTARGCYALLYWRKFFAETSNGYASSFAGSILFRCEKTLL